MRISSSSRHLLTSALFVLVACRGSGSGDDGTTPDAPPNVNDAKIQDIQNPDNRIPIGANVSLNGVVVTAIDTYAERADGTRKGNIWIEEPEGGPYSGVLVFGAPADQVANLAVGDVIDIAGAAKTEFALTGTTGDPTPRTTTELQPGDTGTILITKVSSGTPLVPDDVDVIAIAQMDDSGTRPTARDNEFEKWEGVLIRVQQVSQVSTVGLISMEANFQKFRITGGYELDTSLAPFPTNATIDTCYASITGIGDYFFNWKLLPRETSAIEGGGTGCPAAEEGDTLCANGLDDDYDGFLDCADFSCQDTAAACVTNTTVADIQMGNVTGTVNLMNVFITGLDDIPNNRGIWVADALAGAPYNGIYVYTGSMPLDASWVVGATVNVTGNATEFDPNGVGQTLTEVSAIGGVTFVAVPSGAPTPVTGQTAAALSDVTTGEVYEGVLVQIDHAKVTADAGLGKLELTDNAGGTMIMDNDSFDWPTQAIGTCYSTLTGLSNIQLTDDVRTINPRSALDMVAGTGCN